MGLYRFMPVVIFIAVAVAVPDFHTPEIKYTD